MMDPLIISPRDLRDSLRNATKYYSTVNRSSYMAPACYWLVDWSGNCFHRPRTNNFQGLFTNVIVQMVGAPDVFGRCQALADLPYPGYFEDQRMAKLWARLQRLRQM